MIRNLFVLTFTLTLGTLSALGQKPMTITDHLNQQITVNRFGAVVSFRNRSRLETIPTSTHRVCPCGEQAACIESAKAPSDETESTLRVEFPRRGTTLKNGQTLVVTATFRQGVLTVKRRLTWRAGSSVVRIDETLTSSKSLCVSTFEQKTVSLEMKMCPRPPGYLPCPPKSQLRSEAVQEVVTTTVFDFSK